MKFAISLGTLNPARWVEAVETSDRLGYESVWLPEHLVLPVTMSGGPHEEMETPFAPDLPIYDVFGCLGYLVAHTERIRFGTQVYNIGLRHPFVSARGAATMNLLSGGRFDFGIGASWLKEEWDAVGLDFENRGSRVDEAIEVCGRLWSEDTIEHHGRWFDFAPVKFEPKPADGGVPLHIGGDGAAAIRRAGTVGEAWMPMMVPLERLPAAAERIAEWREKAGRPGRTEISTIAEVEKPEDRDRLAAAGVDRVFVKPWRRSAEVTEGLERFAETFPGLT